MNETTVALPDPIRPDGYAQRQEYVTTWGGGVKLLGAGILIVPGRTLDNPDDAEDLAAAVLAAAAEMRRRTRRTA